MSMTSADLTWSGIGKQSREVRRAGGFATKAAATVTEKVYFDITIGGKEAGKLRSVIVGTYWRR